MAMISIQNASLTLGGPLLLDDVTLQIEEGQRVCLLGRNGAGKSTFLRVMHGDVPLDKGIVARQQGLRVSMLPQDVPQGISGQVYGVIAEGMGEAGKALAEYHAVSVLLEAGESSPELSARLQKAQQGLDIGDGWTAHQTVQSVINHLKLDAEAEFASLSGGMKRRVMLARALAAEPDVLLLDEPTNHLDVDSIDWLEEFLLRRVRTLVLITHDRMFLRKVANRIIELDRGHLADWSCDYDTFLERKDGQLHAEQQEWARLDQKLAEEEVWIRKGIKARRTRNMGRVRDLYALREERAKRRERLGTVSMQVQEAERSGQLVVEARNLTYTYPDADKPVISDASLVISRGDKVGLLGPNGVGKTTMLKLLLGRLQPQSGTVRHGTRLEIAYFDQLRAELDDSKSVRDNVANGNDTVEINGARKHVVGYLKEFLFDPQRIHMPVSCLSGGERNRLLLARLFTKPSNVLVFDEPTNDLDMETLDLLEELIAGYSGTVLVVSHDRAFLNNVVTSTLAFEGNGRVCEYVGGYDDWLRQRPEPVAQAVPRESAKKAASKSAEEGGAGRQKKLSFNEQRELSALREELEALPARVAALEEEQHTLEADMADPGFYTRDPQGFAAATDRLQELEMEQLDLLERWEAAEQRVAELEQFRE
ncbi:ATP-binding cassette domain-containing protein [Desulfovibrio mangrovi]|uniref:ATP-binding cassette domain-containing protein n=1 Tax=Desulfovibrio mangrovi TaxID=2976983 RepID=UPI002247DD50|nr:ATP-binding cassette domain-containing protein [Desulfovibrio mangrovi]UZP67956.1 ATP-binding cassette domain-containing protein [Desulfovibrio mangrovi]